MQTIDEFTRGTEHVEDRAHLAARLARGDRLRIKFGVDPTAPDLHLGHTVPMRRLRAWQDAGHVPVIIIGDWTARIGDPTGRSETRPALSSDEVERNARTYLDQLFLILDRDRTEVRRQTEWFDSMALSEILRLCASRTVQQLLQRSDFTERMQLGRAVGVHELMYPLLQGYDSVAVDADVEIGGTDQLFNLLAARDVQRFYGREEPQDVVTFPILEGLDGVRKMSKSYGNYIGIADPPDQQFGRAMSIPDDLIVKYLTLATDVDPALVARVEEDLRHDRVNPRDAKALMARAVVAEFHGEEVAARAEAAFRSVVGGGGLPEDMPEARIEARDTAYEALDLVERALRSAGETPPSRSALRRLFEQGGVSLLDPAGGAGGAVRSPAAAVRVAGGATASTVETHGDGGGDAYTVHSGAVLKVGKRTFVRLVAGP